MANDWRSAAAYQYLTDLSAPDLAFEFLRRNPDYRADFQQANEQDALGEGTEAHAGLARRWGLRFPRGSGSARRRASGLLAAGGPRQ